MPVKSIPQKGMQSKPKTGYEQDEMQWFVNDEAMAMFNNEVKERKIHLEKGFLLKSEDNFGLPSAVSNTIEAHQWTQFAAHPHNPIVPLVCEFYSNIFNC